MTRSVSSGDERDELLERLLRLVLRERRVLAVVLDEEVAGLGVGGRLVERRPPLGAVLDLLLRPLADQVDEPLARASRRATRLTGLLPISASTCSKSASAGAHFFIDSLTVARPL